MNYFNDVTSTGCRKRPGTLQGTRASHPEVLVAPEEMKVAEKRCLRARGHRCRRESYGPGGRRQRYLFVVDVPVPKLQELQGSVA